MSLSWFRDDRDKEISVGVEIEFLVAYVGKDESQDVRLEDIDPWHGHLPFDESGGNRPLVAVPLENPDDLRSDDLRARGRVRYRVENAVFDAVEQAFQMASNGELKVKSIKRTALGESMEEEELWADHYILKRDRSVEQQAITLRSGKSGESYRTYYFRDVEACTPIYKTSSPEFPRKLEQGIKCLRWNRSKVNDTCGVHVHVGLDDSTLFSTITHKKLGTILWLAEARMERLTRPDRVTCRWCNRLTKNAMLSTHERINIKLGPDIDYQQWLAPVLEAHDPTKGGVSEAELDRLRSLFCELWMTAEAVHVRRLLGIVDIFTSSRLAYNFATGKKNTVEFRLLEGTLDSDVISAWTFLCQAIVHLAVVQDPPAFQFLIGNLLRGDDEYTIFDFMGKDGVDIGEDRIKVFKKKIELGHTNPTDHDLGRNDEATILSQPFNPEKEYRGDFVPLTPKFSMKD